MKTNQRKVTIMRRVSRFSILAFAALAVLPRLAHAQNARDTSDYFYYMEANVFGGVSYYAPVDSGLGTRYSTNGVVGVRVTENVWDYFGIEESATVHSPHNLTFRDQIQPNVTIPSLQVHNYEPGLNLLAYLTDRKHHVRPFFTVGIEGAFWTPTKQARAAAGSLDPSLGFAPFGPYEGIEGTYGAGIKWQTARWFGVRADIRGSLGRNPEYGLPPTSASGSSVYIPVRFLQGIETTIGVSFYIGGKEAPPPPPPPPPAPVVIAPHNLNASTITASATSVCPGDAVRLSSNASDPQSHALAYQWSVDGRNQGGNSPTYTFTPDRAGNYRIGLHLTDTASANGATAVDVTPVSINVRQYAQPTATGWAANPKEIDRGQTAVVHISGTGSDCGGTLTYSWAASEGVVNGNGANAQFNSTSVTFNDTDRSRPQSKQVRVTATVTDAKGGSASASGNITVDFGALASHFGDIVFPKDSARVNNCGKRVLIEQLYPMLTANPNYDVVLVGHIDSSEVPKGKSTRNRGLDRSRVLNTAAVLSGGSGTCTSLDRSRIKGSWVGATQETESLPTSCSVSTTAPKERSGASVNAGEAKNRRVEIWLVPKGMPLPAAARDAKDLPDADMKKIGCPK
jgi:outer membrane protein OmpA-like peptidoglycan-associated protein